jgi:hypothetical protein
MFCFVFFFILHLCYFKEADTELGLNVQIYWGKLWVETERGWRKQRESSDAVGSLAPEEEKAGWLGARLAGGSGFWVR